MADTSPNPPQADEDPFALQTSVYQIAPQKLSKLKKNARYMTGDQLRRLVDNIKTDGALTSVPLIYNVEGAEGGTLLVLSGNHRVEAAVSASTPLIWVMEIITRLDEQRLVALQLSHNAITGQDDPNLLFELYDGLDLAGKLYSGLTDDAFKLPELDLTGLSLATPDYQELTLMFLPAEAVAFKQVITDLGDRAAKGDRLAASYEDFNRLFDTLIRAKDVLKIYNTAVAIRAMCDLATQKLDEIEAAEREAEDKEKAAPGPSPEPLPAAA